MSTDDTDNRDKTVFRQPVNRGDGTVVRPIPGGRVSNEHTSTHAPVSPEKRQSPLHYTRTPNVDLAADQFKTAYGLNSLVNAAAMLIAVFCKTRESVGHPNVGGLHQQLVREIKTFDTTAREEGLKPEIVLSARYILCTILDEAVLNTPWGAESPWTQRTLLSTFHNETGGGEKFFLILDRMRSSPAENLDILELIYICISLGYEGKYRVISRGRDALEQIRDELFRIIRTHRGEYERSLSPRWHGLAKTRNTLAQYVPLWVVAAIFIGILALSYSGFRYWLHQSTNSVVQQLTEISKTDTTEKKNKFDSKSPSDLR